MKRIIKKDIRDFLGIDHYPNQGKFSNTKDWQNYQDPTWLTFRMYFEFNNLDYDGGYTSALYTLLLDDNQIDSATNYLLRVNRPTEASMIKEFRKQLKDISENKPWYFQTVNGLDTLMTPPNFQEGLHSIGELTVECLESVDQQMHFLADLYNNGLYDINIYRTLLPDNMKKFDMKIYVTEVRDLYEIQKSLDELNEESFGFERTESKGMDVVDDYQSQIENNYAVADRKAQEIQKNITDGIFSYAGVKTTDSETEKYKNVLESLNKNMTIRVFTLYGCEFVFDTFPGHSSLTVATRTDPVAFSFKIKPTSVKSFSMSYYGFFEWAIDQERNKQGTNDSTYGPNTLYNQKQFNRNENSFNVIDAFINPVDSMMLGLLNNNKPKFQLKNIKNLADLDPEYQSSFNVLGFDVGNQVASALKEQGEVAYQNYKKQLEKEITKAKNDIVNQAMSYINGEGTPVDKNRDLTEETLKKIENDLTNTKNIFQKEYQNSNSTLNKEEPDMKELVEKGTEYWKNNILYDNSNANYRSVIDSYFSNFKLNITKYLNNSNLSSVKLASANFLNDIQDLVLKVPGFKNNIDELKLLLTEPLKNIDKLELLINQYKKDLQDLDLNKSPYQEVPNDIDLSESPYQKDPNDINLSESPYMKDPNDIDLSESPYMKDPNDIYLSESPYMKDPNDINLSESPYKNSIDQLELVSPPINDKIQNIELSRTAPKNDIQNIKLDMTQINNNIQNINLSETPIRSNIDNLEFDVIDVKNIEPTDLVLTKSPYKLYPEIKNVKEL